MSANSWAKKLMKVIQILKPKLNNLENYQRVFI